MKKNIQLGVILCSLFMAQFLQAQSLTTLFGANNGFAGNTFDVKAKTQDLVINSFDVNLDNFVGDNKTISIYYKVGTSVGFENNMAAWTLLGSASVTSAGIDNPTPVPVGGLTITAGTTYGIYVDYTNYNGGDLIGYTNGGPSLFENADIELNTNTGQAAPGFSGSFFPRQWNGTIYYSPPVVVVEEAPIPTMSEWGLLIFGLLVVNLGVFFIYRKEMA